MRLEIRNNIFQKFFNIKLNAGRLESVKCCKFNQKRASDCSINFRHNSTVINLSQILISLKAKVSYNLYNGL